MRDFHNLPPNLGGQASAHGAIHRPAVIVADPDAAGEMARITNEPGVAEILCCASLAGSWMIGNAGALAGSRDEREVEHVVHGADVERVDDLFGARDIARKQHAARTHTDAADGMRLDCRSAIAENAVCAGHLEQRHFRRSKWQRRTIAKIASDAKPVRGLDRLAAPNRLVEPHRDRIDRLRQSLA